jgi:tetratricopeptide (TPR) repeat protein
MAFAAVAIAVVSFIGGRLSTQGQTPSGSGVPLAAGAAPFAAGAAGGSGGAPDITNMSPRERAARLYDRIMRYEEEKRTDSIQVFAPMALAAYEMLGAEFDTDARYDYGRIAEAAGKFDIALAQADTITKQFPNHLLALALQARTALSQGKSADASKIWKQFLSVKDAELKKAYPEYQNHAGDIDAATRLATSK